MEGDFQMTMKPEPSAPDSGEQLTDAEVADLQAIADGKFDDNVDYSDDEFKSYTSLWNKNLIARRFEHTYVTDLGKRALAASSQPATAVSEKAYSYPDALKEFFPNVDPADFEQKTEVTETTETPQLGSEIGEVRHELKTTSVALEVCWNKIFDLRAQLTEQAASDQESESAK